MKLFKNPTSPFARIAHGSLIAAGLTDRLTIATVDQWSNPPELLAVNSAGRIPCLVLEDGTAIAECLLIAAYAETVAERIGRRPAAALLAEDLAAIGLALGICDAAVQTMVGRRILSGSFADHGFDETPIGRKRRDALVEGLKRLETSAPTFAATGDDLPLPVLSAVTAVDYVDLRFPSADWRPNTPRLEALRTTLVDHLAIAETRPQVPR